MKRTAIKILCVAIVGIGATALVWHSQNNLEEFSEIELQNIEALTQVESPCNNYNGYRRIQQGNEKIYDCCFKEQIGRGKDDCKSW